MPAETADQDLSIFDRQGIDAEMLSDLSRATAKYFFEWVNAKNGLIPDTSQPASPASIAAVGLALCVYVVSVKRKYLTRTEAVEKTLAVLRFFHTSPQGPEPDATGYKGFYYHFLDMTTGRRAWECELSTIDTAILIAGALTAASYFDGGGVSEGEVRELADSLYRRVDWTWALDGKATVSHGWKPESGFLPGRWDQEYCEAHIIYVLALGSPTFPIDPAGYRQWTETFQWRKFYDLDYFYAGPLFIHQLSQMWLDCRGIMDDANRNAGFDYFENSRRATYIQRQYGIENPHGFARYSANCWGFTASAGPGPRSLNLDGVHRDFYGYLARGAPLGPDDGTISPWAVAASLPFAPEIVLGTLRHAIEQLDLKRHSAYGFDASFNATFPDTSKNRNGWISPWICGLNQGPIILMIENHASGLIWNTVRKCPHIQLGLRRAGFRGGWLDDDVPPAESAK